MKYQVFNLTEQIGAAKKTCSEQHIQLEIKAKSFEWQENPKKQLKNQEEEMKSLNTKVDDLTKEVQMLKYCGKTKIYAEELEGTSKIISNLKILIEEAKRFEKIMKNQLSSNESFFQKLNPEMEEVRGEEGSTCLTKSEIKKNYDGTLKNIFTRSE